MLAIAVRVHMELILKCSIKMGSWNIKLEKRKFVDMETFYLEKNLKSFIRPQVVSRCEDGPCKLGKSNGLHYITMK